MLDAASKAFFHALAQIPTLQRLASRYGMAEGTGFARRFIAGESIEEAIHCVAGLPTTSGLSTRSWRRASSATSR
jgi:hypothetical protein